jgi:hypothetical protein
MTQHTSLLECQFITHDVPKEEGSVFLGYFTLLTEELLCSLNFPYNPGMKLFAELV